MARVRNQRWKEYGTQTAVPHGIGRELLLMHELPEKGYNKSRRKQLNRFWGIIYRTLIGADIIDGEMLDEMFAESYGRGGQWEFGEKEHYVLGRLIAHALVEEGSPVIAFDPNEVVPDIVEGTQVLAIECLDLPEDIYQEALDEGFTYIPEELTPEFGKVEWLADIADRGMAEDACILVMAEKDMLGEGFDKWELRMGAVPVLKHRVRLLDAAWLARQPKTLQMEGVDVINQEIQDMVELAATPWERKRKARAPGKTGGVASIPKADVEEFMRVRAPMIIKAEAAWAAAKDLGYDVQSADTAGERVILYDRHRQPFDFDTEALAQTAIDRGLYVPPEDWSQGFMESYEKIRRAHIGAKGVL